MRIFLTGHSGFIGSHLLNYFEKQGHEVITEIIPLDGKYSDTFRKAISRADRIIHLAGKNRASDFELYSANVLSTLSLMDAVKTYNPKIRVVFASSFQVLYETSLYGISKKACEDIVSVYAKRNGLNSTVLRLSNVYGPGCKPFYNSVIATYIYQAVHNEPLTVNQDGSQQRDYIYIDDVVHAFSAAVEQPDNQQNFQLFSICSGKHTALKDIITYIREVSRKNVQIVTTNNPEPQQLPVEQPDKALAVLGWKPTVSIAEGIQQIFMKEYGHSST